MLKNLFKHLLDLPVPKNISWWWLGGSMLLTILFVQIMTGYFISCFYTNESLSAFSSVDSLNRDMNYGSKMRHLHIFGASAFFFMMYLHMGRALYYKSFLKNLKAWMSGVMLYLLLMMTSFVGYVLPWAQMSFWAATVITKFITVMPIFGTDMVQWVWGSFSVDYTTLMRFYTLHFLLPSILAMLSILHVIVLHDSGSSSPLGVLNSYQRFSGFCLVKDSLGVSLILVLLLVAYYMHFMIVSDSEQYIEANPFVTPVHMVPEWYFLPAYAILRSVPKKLGGVCLLIAFILILLIFPFIYNPLYQAKSLSTVKSFLFWCFIMKFFLLVYLGGSIAEQPFILFSQICTLLYFLYFFSLGILKSLFSEKF